MLGCKKVEVRENRSVADLWAQPRLDDALRAPALTHPQRKAPALDRQHHARLHTPSRSTLETPAGSRREQGFFQKDKF